MTERADRTALPPRLLRPAPMRGCHMGLPSPTSYSLLEAVTFVVQRCECSEHEAKAALQRAGLDGRIIAAGMIPLSAYPNPKIREAHPARRREHLRPEDWGGQIDWDTGKVGPYFSVLIDRKSIENWLGTASPTAGETGMPKRGGRFPGEAVLVAKARGHVRAGYTKAEADRASTEPAPVEPLAALLQLPQVESMPPAPAADAPVSTEGAESSVAVPGKPEIIMKTGAPAAPTSAPKKRSRRKAAYQSPQGKRAGAVLDRMFEDHDYPAETDVVWADLWDRFCKEYERYAKDKPSKLNMPSPRTVRRRLGWE